MFKQKVAVAQKTILRGKKIDVAQKVISGICCRRNKLLLHKIILHKKEKKNCAQQNYFFSGTALRKYRLQKESLITVIYLLGLTLFLS